MGLTPVPAAGEPFAGVTTRAVAYWHVRPHGSDLITRFRVEAILNESLTGESTLAVAVTREAGCVNHREGNIGILKCPTARRVTWKANEGTLDVAPDLSTVALQFELGRNRYEIDWASPTSSGAWDSRRLCGPSAQLRGGLFRNMGEFSGSLPGARVAGPRAPSDHAWVERGASVNTC